MVIKTDFFLGMSWWIWRELRWLVVAQVGTMRAAVQVASAGTSVHGATMSRAE